MNQGEKTINHIFWLLINITLILLIIILNCITSVLVGELIELVGILLPFLSLTIFHIFTEEYTRDHPTNKDHKKRKEQRIRLKWTVGYFSIVIIFVGNVLQILYIRSLTSDTVKLYNEILLDIKNL